MSSPPASRRRYDATGRRAQAQANRERILQVATRLFCAQGYAATSIAQIAAEAGVSTPTVFAASKSKVNLLKEAVDIAIVGDAQAVPLVERPEMRHVHQAATAGELLRRYAAVMADVATRAYPIYAVAAAAADSDPQIAELVKDLDRQRLTGATYMATAVADRTGGAGPDRLAYLRDTIWTVNSPPLFGLLVHQRGWSPEAYRDWIGAALIALTSPPLAEPPSSRAANARR